MIARRVAAAAAADAGAAVVPEGQPGRPAGDPARAAVGDAAAVDGRRVRASRRSRSGSRWSTASRRSTSSASQKYAVRVDVDPRELAAHGIGIDEVASAISTRQRRTCRPAPSTARQDLRRADQRSADAGRRVRADDHRLPQRQSGAARGSRARLRRRRERQVGEPGSSGERCVMLSIQQAAGHERRRGRRSDQGSCCRRSASSCRPSVTLDIRSDRVGRRSASRCTTSS